MAEHFEWRSRTRRALGAYFQRRSFPRLILTSVLLVTGISGFALSWAMLHLGVHHMWMRYPVAVGGSYGVLLALIRLWVAFEQSRFDPLTVPDVPDAEDNQPSRTQAPRPGTSWFDWLDLGEFPIGELGLDEGCLVAFVFIIIGVLIFALIAAVASIVAMAPSLIAEVFLDVFVVTALYRRLRAAQKEHWLGTALRKTWLPALGIAAALAIGGLLLEAVAPGAPSIGKAVQQIFAQLH